MTSRFCGCRAPTGVDGLIQHCWCNFDDCFDAGKEIKEEVKQRLIEFIKEKEAGNRGIPAEEVYKKLSGQQQ